MRDLMKRKKVDEYEGRTIMMRGKKELHKNKKYAELLKEVTTSRA